MKKFLLIAGLIWLASAAQAQQAQGTRPHRNNVPQLGTLKPRVIVEGADTSFVFSARQLKELAKLITIGEFDKQEIGLKDKQVSSLSTKVEVQRSITLLRENEIMLLQQKIQERDSLVAQLDGMIDLQHKEIKHKDRQLHRQSLLAKGLTFLGIVLFVIVIIILL
jgi:hypothetical protein